MGATIERGVELNIAQAGRSNAALGRTLERLASGRRVRRAADDPAGLAVAVNLSTTDLATRRAMKNMNDGVSLIHIAEGAATATIDVLQRMRELAMQSSSETLATKDRNSVQDEYGGLMLEIDRVASSAEFNGMPLANGGLAGIVVHVGGGTGLSHRISVQLGDMRSAQLGVSSTSVSTLTGAQSALDGLDGALDTVNGVRSRLGASHNRLISALHHAESYRSSLSDARSRIQDADMGHETSRLVTQSLRQAGGLTALRSGLRSLESSRGLLASAGSSQGGAGFGLAGGGGVPPYEKGDFPEDLV
jgi:flagellin